MNAVKTHTNRKKDQIAKKWYAVYTYVKCEKLVERLLTTKGIEVYLPIRQIIKEYKTQRRKKMLPLIPSYIFVNIHERDFARVLETEKVVSFITFSGRKVAIPEEEIEVLRRLVGDSTIDIKITENNLQVGNKAQVVVGSMAGLTGVLKDIKMNKEVVLELENVGYTFSITVKKEYIKAL